MATESDTPIADMSGEELVEKFESGEVSIADLMEHDEFRRRVTRFVVERDIEEHRDVYERLSEV